MSYRGRIAPTPTGHLHLGHARTFWVAQERARKAGGVLILRDEDLDRDRCRPDYAVEMLEDLQWFGLRWTEGPDCGGPFGPYRQSERRPHFLQVWRQLADLGCIYPSPQSRKDVQQALSAPHEDGEPIFPLELRPPPGTGQGAAQPGAVNWRFRVPDGIEISFQDGLQGDIVRTAGVDFGDFLVWRKDGFPSYELAVVTDDHLMQITEVVRGADLLTSTARQLLLYRALGWAPPAFCHCPLVCDPAGNRLAKRSQAVSLRTLREQGRTPAELRNQLGLDTDYEVK